MKASRLIIAVLLAVAVLLTFGCERKVVVEEIVVDDGNGGNGSQTESCFDCHSDQDFSLVYAGEQWEISAHGAGETVERNRQGSSFYQSCEKCHTSEGFLEFTTGYDHDGTVFTRIGCFTCHAPHTNEDFDLTYDDAVDLADGTTFDRDESNLCVVCHQSRRDVNTYVVDDVTLDQRYGPHHSNQSDMLLGTNAYEYAGITYTNSAHTNGVVNPCVQCHMAGTKGWTEMYVGGHTFAMQSEESGLTNVEASCNASGCHSDLESFNKTAYADYDWDGEVEGVQDEVHGLMDSLETLLIAGGLFEYYEEEEGWAPADDRFVTDADSTGAVYNYMFVYEDQSAGIHNTDYAVQLLQSSINFLAEGDPAGSAVTEMRPFAVLTTH